MTVPAETRTAEQRRIDADAAHLCLLRGSAHGGGPQDPKASGVDVRLSAGTDFAMDVGLYALSSEACTFFIR